MSIFALVSQSLRTGEPIHQILPTSLLDRLLYHSSHQKLSEREEMHHLKVAEKMASLDFTYFATGKSSLAIEDLDSLLKIIYLQVSLRSFKRSKRSMRCTALRENSAAKYPSEGLTNGNNGRMITIARIMRTIDNSNIYPFLSSSYICFFPIPVLFPKDRMTAVLVGTLHDYN